jgi:hypothetical protein
MDMDVRSVLIVFAVLSGGHALILNVLLLRQIGGRSGGAGGSGAGQPLGARWCPPPVQQVYRVMVAVDIDRFGRTRWDDEIRVRSVRALREAVAGAFAAAGIPHEHWSATSTGDGLLVSANPDVGTANVLRALLDRLADGLTTRNRLMVADAWLRLRVVLHAGHVMLDDQTVLGAQVNHTFRLLEADSLRRRLHGSQAPAVVAVSQHVYEQVVQQRALGLDPSHFEPLLVNVKETSASAWVYAPGAVAAAGQLPAPTHDLSVPTDYWVPERAS